MNSRKLLFAILFVLGCSYGSFAQGSETFTNSNATTSYANNSYVGDNGVTWTYTQSRDDGGYQITGAGLMLRRSSDNSKVVSSSASGGFFRLSLGISKVVTVSDQKIIKRV